MDGSTGSPRAGRMEPAVVGNRDWRVWLLIWLSLLTFAFVRTPVPGLNESHYLTRARHFYDPAWLAGDFFLESSSPHGFFYAACGWLTLLLPLSATAILGRVVSLAVVVWGWQSMLRRLRMPALAPLWSCWCFLLLAAIGNLSGEWLVGGFESKVFAWGLSFAAAGQILSHRWILAGGLGGLAVSFHPIVGGWAALCATVATLALWWRERPRPAVSTANPRGEELPGPPCGAEERFTLPTAARLLATCGVFVLLAAPGLWPAMRMLRDTNPRDAYYGDYLQVFYRLAHHLDPMVFSPLAWAGYGVLLAVWVAALVFERAGRQRAGRFPRPAVGLVWWRWFVCGSLVLGLAGLLAGAGPRPPAEMPGFAWRMKLLKFYPFRLVDILLPLAVAVEFCQLLWQWLADRKQAQAAVSLICGLAFAASLLLPAPDRRPAGMSPAVQRDWVAACRWIAEQTPEDAVFLGPNASWGFRWWAMRREYVSYKDAPQDASGLIEWNRRLKLVSRWAEERWDDPALAAAGRGGYSQADLQWLRRETGITHLLVQRLGPFAVEPLYENDTFRVYRLPE